MGRKKLYTDEERRLKGIECAKAWQRNNKAKRSVIANRYIKKRYATDELFRIKLLMRAQIYHSINGGKGRGGAWKRLNYTVKDFYERFEEEIGVFKMYGLKFAVDHCIPLEWFKEDAPIHLTFNLDNLQIISTIENSEKQHCYPSTVSFEYLNIIKPYIKPEYLCW